MIPLFSYLKFWRHSKNEHSVHSPFVYNLVTKCFYDRTKYNGYKQLHKNDSRSKFLFRLGAYFKFDHHFIFENMNPKFKHALSLNHKISVFKTVKDLNNKEAAISKAPCLIYVDLNTIEKDSIVDLFQICHKDSLILIPSIRKNKTQLKRWNQLKSHLEVSVSIDTFYWGLLFFRTEQPKEHFTIRL